MNEHPAPPDPNATHQQLLKYARDLAESHAQERQKGAELAATLDKLRAAYAALETVRDELESERNHLDVKVRERTAELAAANAELRHTGAMKDEFLANMSHELRTPLNGILILTEVLLRGLQGPLTDPQRTSLQTVHQSGHHLLQLINDILDVSKIGAGALDLALEIVEIPALIKSACSLVKQSAQKKAMQIARTIAPDARAMLADSRRMKQILVNLLSNAVKFTPEGGRVGLEVKLAGADVEFSVWDTGIGIAADSLARLFRPFHQLDSSLNRRFEGTGLGLVLVKRLTELHGGTVAVESTVGAGSRFTVRVPTRLAEQPPPSAEESSVAEQWTDSGTRQQSVTAEAPRILLGEDNAVNSQAMVVFLTAKGFQVDVARDGLAVVDMARAVRYDLIIMDVQMPRMDGLAATRELKAMPGTADIPIVILTAMAMKGDRERCIAAGADEYLTKPVALADLLRVLRQHLDASDSPDQSPDD